MTFRAVLCALCVLCGSIALPAGARVQTARGTVSDSVSGQPIAGAVVSLLDSAGMTIARFITTAQGEYRFPGFTLGRRVRVVRMGYRPRDVRLPTPPSDERIVVRMLAIPMMLEQVRVVANPRCPGRSDRAAALALLEQARAGLLNAVVAREQLPAAMTSLAYERQRGARGEILRQEVRIKSSDRVTTSFYAVRKAAEFVRDGFVEDSADTRIYYGPDVDVLLDEQFTTGYCFHLRAPRRERPNQVGLAVVPATRRSRRFDIDGTLWIDTAARTLRELEYRYLGLPLATDVVAPGGRATFWELDNGVFFIDKWNFRLPVAQYDTTRDHNNNERIRTWYSMREPGGEVAHARWPDGETYRGPLGTLNARAVGLDMKPLTGIVVRLEGTDYIASPDSLGFFAIDELLPGPYSAVVIYPEQVQLGITLPTSLQFIAARDSVIQSTMAVPDPWLYVMRGCADTVQTAKPGEGGFYNLKDGKLPGLSDTALLISVVTPDKKPVTGAHWRLSKATETSSRRITESRETDEKGQARSCLRMHEKDEVELTLWRTGEAPRTWTFTFTAGQRYWFTLPFPR